MDRLEIAFAWQVAAPYHLLAKAAGAYCQATDAPVWYTWPAMMDRTILADAQPGPVCPN